MICKKIYNKKSGEFMSEIKEENNRSLFGFIVYFIIKINKDDIFALSAQLAYYLMLSFFPFLIFLMTLIGFSNLDSMEVIGGLRNILPSTVFQLVSSTIVEIIETQSTGLLGASILLVIWASSSAFRAVIKGLNKAYGIKENRHFIKRAFIAIICTFSLAFVIILTLIMLVFGTLIGDLLVTYLPFENLIERVWNILRYIVVIIVMICTFAAIYRYTPSKRIHWKNTFPGAIVCTIGWLAVSVGFAFYINNFGNYSKLYGSLGAVIVLITWLYLTSMLVIIGGEVNSVLVIRRNNLRIK